MKFFEGRGFYGIGWLGRLRGVKCRATSVRKNERCHRYGGYQLAFWLAERIGLAWCSRSERGAGIPRARYWLATRREEALTTQAHSTWPNLLCTHAQLALVHFTHTLFLLTLSAQWIYQLAEYCFPICLHITFLPSISIMIWFLGGLWGYGREKMENV